MGAAATLFFSSNDAEKQTLHRRISPSDEQFEEQQERWNSLADHLIVDLKNRSNCNIATWLQGSYKFGTQVRPVRMDEEFDIDLGVYFEWEGGPEDGDFGSKALKRMVQESLEDFAVRNSDDVREVTERKTRCSRTRYWNGFHIDVPAYHLSDAGIRTLATEEGWENSDPKAIYQWFKNAFDDIQRAKVRRQVKYLKAWSALHFKIDGGRPSSILLTILVADAALEMGLSGGDDDVIRDILEAIIARLKESDEVPNPVNKDENLNRLSDEELTAFVARLSDLLEVAERALDRETELEAADVWQEEFLHLYPMPDAEDLAKSLTHLPVPVAIPEVRVEAVSNTNAAARFHGTNAIGPIPKSCTITFEVTNTHALPRNSTIYWMVRNEGREAENTNDLGHVAGTGATATEQSAYRGRHFMDCIVRVGRQTIAMRRVPVEISGLEVPKRAAKRPDWVRLRGKR